MIICAGEIESFDFAVPIGIGLVESAMNLTRLSLFDRPDFLLFVGTAGSYGAFAPFEIVSSRSASNIELSFLQNQSYTPLDNVISAEGENVSHETFMTGKAATIVNSSNYITTDKTLAKKFLALGIGLENMEFFSVLSVAREFNIPSGGLFIVTNYCDQNAHEDFVKNHKKAKKILASYIHETILRKRA